MFVRRFAIAAGLAFAAMAPASPVLAQGYPGGTNNERSPGEVLGTGADRTDGAQVRGVQVARGETLPLTGTDAVQLGVVGIVLVGGGIVLVKRSRRQPEQAAA